MTSRRGALGRLELLGLWLSYQRYAFLMGAVAAAVAVVPFALWPRRFYLWVPALLLAAKLLGTAAEIYRRWPRKLRATLAASRRIAAGNFAPEFVRNYCGDPCFRVVAGEILRRAGVAQSERRRLIARFAAEQRTRKDFVLLVDRSNGVSIRVEGDNVNHWKQSQH